MTSTSATFATAGRKASRNASVSAIVLFIFQLAAISGFLMPNIVEQTMVLVKPLLTSRRNGGYTLRSWKR